MTATILHATTVAFDPGAAVLLCGPSGSGKSRLALRLIEQGARLVADDRTLIWREGAVLYARAPRPIAGLIEVRGLGILQMGALRLARAGAMIDLSRPVQRLPDPGVVSVLGVDLPLLGGGDDLVPAGAIRHLLSRLATGFRP